MTLAHIIFQISLHQSNPKKIQNDQEIQSTNHNDDFSFWCLFFQE